MTIRLCVRCGRAFDDENERHLAAKIRRHERRVHPAGAEKDSMPILAANV